MASEWTVDYGPWSGPDGYCSNAHVCWYGWGGGVGSISTILHGNGRAFLNFGNCYTGGQVKVSKNDIEILSLDGLTTAQIEIEFQDGDVIKLSEHNVGVIQFNDLSIVECITPTIPTTTTMKDMYTNSSISSRKWETQIRALFEIHIIFFLISILVCLQFIHSRRHLL